MYQVGDRITLNDSGALGCLTNLYNQCGYLVVSEVIFNCNSHRCVNCSNPIHAHGYNFLNDPNNDGHYNWWCGIIIDATTAKLKGFISKPKQFKLQQHV